MALFFFPFRSLRINVNAKKCLIEVMEYIHTHLLDRPAQPRLPMAQMSILQCLLESCVFVMSQHWMQCNTADSLRVCVIWILSFVDLSHVVFLNCYTAALPNRVRCSMHFSSMAPDQAEYIKNGLITLPQIYKTLLQYSVLTPQPHWHSWMLFFCNLDMKLHGFFFYSINFYSKTCGDRRVCWV